MRIITSSSEMAERFLVALGIKPDLTGELTIIFKPHEPVTIVTRTYIEPNTMNKLIEIVESCDVTFKPKKGIL